MDNMRSLALVCAAVLAVSCMAAGALAEESVETLDGPAPEVYSTAVEPSVAASATVFDNEATSVTTPQEPVAQGSQEQQLEDSRENSSESPSASAEGTSNASADGESGGNSDENSPEELGAPETDGAFEERLDPPQEEAPAAEPTAEPTPEPTPEPTAEPTPEPTVEAMAPAYEADAKEEAPGALSFSGWDYADMWNTDNEKENSGIVSVKSSTTINARPSDQASVLTRVSRGTELEYLNVTEYDGNGVAWYQVYWDGYTGWVPSYSTRLWWPTYY